LKEGLYEEVHGSDWSGIVDRSGYRLCSPPKADYQWTGTVLEADGDHLVVKKGDQNWEFAYDKDTKVTGNLKVEPRLPSSTS